MTAPHTPLDILTPTPSATIDQSSLTNSSGSPVITGAYLATNGLALVIVSGNVSLPSNTLPSMTAPGTVFRDESDHGGSLQMTGFSTGEIGGRFTENTIPSLTAGTYTAGIYNVVGQYSSSGYQGNTYALLTTGTLNVTSSGTNPQPNASSPSVSVAGVSGFTVSVQYANMPVGDVIEALAYNSQSSSWIARTTSLSNTTGSVSLVLPSNTPSGQYYVVAVDGNGNAVEARDASNNIYPATAPFTIK